MSGVPSSAGGVGEGEGGRSDKARRTQQTWELELASPACTSRYLGG